MPAQVAAAEEFDENSDALFRPSRDSPVVSTSENRDGEISQMIPEGQPEVLETASERRARRHSHWIIYITAFVMSIGFSIVLTGVWPYLQRLDAGVSKEFLGWAIAANPLGQMVASPLLGLWGNKAGSNRGAFLTTILLFIVGNILYAILSLFGTAARGVMIFSRFLVGISSANIAIIRSYIASSTTLKERTTAVALTSAAQGLGFIIGPAIQAALAVAFSHEKTSENKTSSVPEILEDEAEDAGLGIEWNMYTATGWVATFLGALNFFLFMPCIFKEYPIAAKEAQLKRDAAKEDKKLPKPDYLALVGVLVSFFIILFIYVLIETLLVPMCIDLYAWTDEQAITVVGVGLSIAGAVSVIMFTLTSVLTRKFDERKVFIFVGLVPLTIAMLIHFPMGNTYPKMQNCTSHDSASELGSLTTVLPNMNFTEPNSSLSRQRRHSARDDTCTDLGCPQKQEWCLYTPIVEMPQMVVADTVAVIGYPVAFTLSSSFFSKLLGPKPQGVWMGILTSTGSFSRVTGPIFVSYMYTALGTRWTFGILFVVMSLTLVIISLLFRRLVPMKLVAT
ncbi:major facilitator superfamily domain-containing protein 8-like isoform X1 [Penaeus chinensis]|uniref:major facilitator superfamily domain-containing protein 8-like isoform X1 n=1 Tax=Penaeus chinensis TaxID=139456 RepID=UPI001FB5762A|nr:major facilitator superfamily domain-containing protein 8-like isoform X1 [Penaeus chinensis]